MKKLWLSLLTLLMLVSLVGCSTKPEEPVVIEDEDDLVEETKIVYSANQFLYKVTAPNGQTGYLLGTMHVQGEYDIFDDVTLEAFNSSDIIMFEVDLDTFGLEDSMRMLYESPLSEVYLDEEIKNNLDQLKELYPSLSRVDLTELNAMGISSLASMELYAEAGVDATNGIDMHLFQMAKDAGKTIAEIESAELQVNYIVEIGKQCPNLILSDLFNKEGQIEGMLAMKEAYQAGDLEAMEEMLTTIPEEGSIPYYEEYLIYQQLLIDDRNALMVEKAKEYYSSDTVYFIAVGLGHVIGETGLIEELSELGFTFERLNGK